MSQHVVRSNDNRSIVEESARNAAIEASASFLLDAHPHFHGRANRFAFECHARTLTVRGSVPSYYLKQVLQSVLRDVPGIGLIDNHVTVDSSDGVSE